MISRFKPAATPIVAAVLVILTIHTPRVCSNEPNGKISDNLPLSSEAVTGPTVRRLPTSVQWEGREYDVDSGIDVLMGVVRGPEKGSNQRVLALIPLAMLYRQLEGRPCMEELTELYDSANEGEKHLILICFLGSEDPRGIPLFFRTLDKEKNMKLRLCAASGLAHWNIRRGVAELVDLLDSTEMLPSPTGRIPYVRDNALDLFRTKNPRKGWGLPETEWWKSIDGRANLDENQKRALYNVEIEKEIKEVKKWFEENQRRFPDWQPGDPLPQVTDGEAKPEGNK